jgi:thymidylate synthase (FAD)
MQVKIVSITEPIIEGILNPEDFISYCARVSNPSNQNNTKTAPKLLKYLIDHKHWSPFEMVSMTFEIKTSRAIAAQILRHRSFSFQEFSQRYSNITDFESFEIRKQAEKNRQSSTDLLDLNNEDIDALKQYLVAGASLYENLLQKGAAKECARMVLPLCTQTTLYMSGNVRSWIHYLDLRTKEDTQKEHREIAESIKNTFIDIFPNISEALEWTKPLTNEQDSI